MGLEVHSCTWAWGFVPVIDEVLGTGLQDRLFSPPRGKGMPWGRGTEGAARPQNAAGHSATPRAAGTKLGNSVLFYLQNAQP